MKIRTDFVTNSSSSSYIIAFSNSSEMNHFLSVYIHQINKMNKLECKYDVYKLLESEFGEFGMSYNLEINEKDEAYDPSVVEFYNKAAEFLKKDQTLVCIEIDHWSDLIDKIWKDFEGKYIFLET